MIVREDLENGLVRVYSDKGVKIRGGNPQGNYDITYIPSSVKVAEASAEGISIYRYAPRCKAAESFMKLTKEVLES